MLGAGCKTQGVPMAEDIDGELGCEEEGDAHIEVEEQFGERGALVWQHLPHVRGSRERSDGSALPGLAYVETKA